MMIMVEELRDIFSSFKSRSRLCYHGQGRENWHCWLTLHLERTPLEASIQTYSAMTLPFCESLLYFSSWEESLSVGMSRRRLSCDRERSHR
jgi:hypothetical protein